MSEEEKIAMVKAVSRETDEGTVSAYLAMAGSRICRRAYPFDPTVTDVPDCYAMTQVEIAVYLLNKRGNEGVISHSENGYSDTFESGDVPEALLRSVVPLCGMVGV